jgi:hypothetical protein
MKDLCVSKSYIYTYTLETYFEGLGNLRGFFSMNPTP